MAVKKKKRISGSDQLINKGKLPILIGLTPEDKEAVIKAAALDDRKMGVFIAHHIARVAREMLNAAKEEKP